MMCKQQNRQQYNNDSIVSLKQILYKQYKQNLPGSQYLLFTMDQNNDKPLLGNNLYPNLAEEASDHKIAVNQNNVQPLQANSNPYAPAQNYPNYYNQYPNQPVYNQGYAQPYQNKGYVPQVQAYQPPAYPQNNQGFQPVMPGQLPPPPPMQPGLGYIALPSCITTAHPKYRFIVEQVNLPCNACFSRGSDQVTMSSGCATFGWSACLFIFTGILCFWIPFVVDGCKDIKISCSRCGHTKAVIEKQCC